MLENLETPRLVLDKGRLEKNAGLFIRRARDLGVALRPHLKTSKSVEVARIAKGGALSGITVSTLKEADYFAAHGFSDILYATGIAPNKFDHVRHIADTSGQRLLLVTDSVQVARLAVGYAAAKDCMLDFLVEVDCGEHRSGLPPDSAEIVEIARILGRGPGTRFRGVMTHAGHSYATDDPADVAALAEVERRSAVDAVALLDTAGIGCDIVSVGSTPTFLFARHLDGVTEVRCGIYLFWDLSQYSRNVCTLDDIALTVLATVIGHNRQGRSIILDAGALALSKDVGANTHLPDAKYGYVCNPDTLARCGTLSVDGVHQEHGTILVDDDAWFDRLPVGSVVRVIPNHACLTAAPYDGYTVVERGRIIGEWDRITGW